MLVVVDRNNGIIFEESFGASSGLNALAWLRDAIIIACGISIRFVNEDKAVIDLIIKEYRLEKDHVTVNEFIYKNAFDNIIRRSLNLNWWEQRPDYFMREY